MLAKYKPKNSRKLPDFQWISCEKRRGGEGKDKEPPNILRAPRPYMLNERQYVKKMLCKMVERRRQLMTE